MSRKTKFTSCVYVLAVYAEVRHKYLREFIDDDFEPSLNSVFENFSIDATRNYQEDVPLVECMHLVFTRMPGENYRRRVRSLLLY